MLNEGNQIHNFISSSGSGTVINYGSDSGSDFLTSYGSGSTSQKVKVSTVPVPQRCLQHALVATSTSPSAPVGRCAPCRVKSRLHAGGEGGAGGGEHGGGGGHG